MTSLRHVISSHGFSYHSYADDTQLFFSFPPSDTTAETRISACLLDIGRWMSNHHLKLNFHKTELLLFPGKDCPQIDLSISLNNTTVLPSQTARSLGVTLDNQLSFTTHIAAIARSCRFALFNIRKIRPFLSREAAQLIIQSLILSRLDYCNVLLAGLPISDIQPLQLVQNAAARLVFNLPKFSHISPLFHELQWLPIIARIKFKTLVLAFTAVHHTSPQYLQPLVSFQIPHRTLRPSTSSGRLAPPPLRGFNSSKSKLFSHLAPKWWNELPPTIRTAKSLPIFKKQLKTHLFRLHVDSL